MDICGYTITEHISESTRSNVYRGTRIDLGENVVLKLPHATYPAPEDLERIRHEYDIIRRCKHNKLINAHGIEEHDRSLALILEDFPGVPLSESIQADSLDLAWFLDVAIQLADALHELHQNGITYKNLCPSNILYRSITGRIKLIDFSIASTEEHQYPLYDKNIIPEGSLYYISPEQSGRIDRELDFRTDFYSLGVCLYELLTGQLPLNAEDPIEQVHNLLAKTPAPPHTINPAIPAPVSAIVTKLLEKSAEKRYQSCNGLIPDLMRCLIDLKDTRSSVEFSPGRSDVSAKFTMPAALFGRDRELEKILIAHEDCCSGKRRLIFVTGPAGIGKTSLVKEAHRIIENRGGFVISGKVDMQSDRIPYGAIIHIFRDLVQRILLESGVEIEHWKRTLLSALGNQAQIMVDVIPELQLIIDDQAPVPELSPLENKYRFKKVFRVFIEACANQIGTLVCFLDDVHWADLDSLELIEDMTRNAFIPGLVICSFRDNEPRLDREVQRAISRISSTTGAATIRLGPLSGAHVAAFLSETCYHPVDALGDLAQTCLEKTAGNPFFLKQLLEELYNAGKLRFNHVTGRWDIEAATVKRMHVMPNVGEMLTLRIAGFSHKTRHALQLAACFGNTFDLALLAAVADKTKVQALSELAVPLDEGLIFRSHDHPRQLRRDHLSTGDQEERFQFAHDHVQKAAYALTPQSQLPETHYKIGKILLRTLSDEEQEKQLFDIVGHLNQGVVLLTSTKEKMELAELNLRAARMAKKTAAFNYYHTFARTACDLLPPSSWTTHYHLMIAVHNELMEAASINKLTADTERYFHRIDTNATTLLDKVKAYQIKVQAYKAENRLDEAIDTGLNIIAKLGVTFPKNPGKLSARRAMVATRLILARKKPDDLLKLPEMDDIRHKAVMDFLLEVGTAAYNAKPELVPLISFTAIRLSLKYGNTINSAIMGYPTYGFLLCGVPGPNISRGYQLGSLALQLPAALGKSESPLVIYLVNNLIVHWKQHLNVTLQPLLEAFRLSLDRGELENAANCAYCYCYRLYILGQRLETTENTLKVYRELIEPLEQRIPLYRHMIFQQTVANLTDPSRLDPTSLDGEHYAAESLLPHHVQGNDQATLFLYHLNSLILCYLFGRHQKAERHAASAADRIGTVVASPFVPLFHFYRSMNLLALQGESVGSMKGERLKQVSRSIKKMRCWASHAPDNFHHKYLLMQAELQRLLDNREQAAQLYDQAIEHARQAGYLQEEALAFERAARFYHTIGRAHVARPYLNEALYCYRRWGATALLIHVAQSYEAGETEVDTPLFRHDIDPGATVLPEVSSRLDMMSVLKAARTFTGEIVLDELLKKLIVILLENAGGQIGYLLMRIDDNWIVKARAEIGESQGTIIDTSLITYRRHLSQATVNYVIRSEKTVVLSNAAEEGLFVNDSYILQNKPKSLLCLPIFYQGKIICVVYMENNLTTGAFHADRLEILSLMASQAAISIRNSRLYEELERTVRELHQEVAIRKETQIQLLHAGKLSALGRLSASIAHEFGNPLIGIRYLLEDLQKREEISGDDKHLIAVGLEECNRMKHLINDLHDLHKPSSATKHRFNLNHTIRNVLLFQRKNLKNSGVNTTTDLAPDLPDIIAVEDQITQVLVNLTINAADAMSHTGGTLRVKSTHRSNWAIITIGDTGCGIREEHQEHLFEPFFSTKQEFDGTGLGLAIAYSIITNHGGDISFTSTVGHGTTFTIRLPIIDASAAGEIKTLPISGQSAAQ